MVGNKEKREPADFSVPADDTVNLKESEWREKNLDLTRELKMTMEYESDGDASYS